MPFDVFRVWLDCAVILLQEAQERVLLKISLNKKTTISTFKRKINLQ